MPLTYLGPADVWNIGHALVGIAMGAIKLPRWFAYGLHVLWEIYQLFVYYQPDCLGFNDVWLNSLLDILTFAIFFEITLPIARRIARADWWHGIDKRLKGAAAFLMINFGGAFVMGWDLKPSSAPALLQTTLVVVPIALCPAIAAWMVRGMVTGEGFADAGLALNFRQKWRYYLAIAILPPVMAVVGVSFLPASNSVLPGWLPPAAAGSSSGILTVLILNRSAQAAQLLVLTLIMTPVLFGQEFGWRGYLQPRIFIQKPLLSAIVSGLIWGFWLALVTWRAYRLSGPAVAGLWVVPCITICLSIILGWITSKTGSIWPASLLHGAIGAVGGSLIFAPVYLKPELVSVSALGIWSLLPLGCLCLWILFNKET